MKRPLNDILDGASIPFAYKLGYMINSYREPSFRAIEAPHGLTRAEILSLFVLAFGAGTAAAERCDFSGHLKNNISRAIAALEGKGLVRREPDPQDQRRLLLYITAAGRRLHDKFMPALQQREQDMMACLSETERRTFEGLLRKLCAHG